MGPARVEATGWGWRHGGRRRFAVRGLDLRIDPGERVLLLGPSGAGKSTLLAGLAGLLDPVDDGQAEGHLTLDGVAAHRLRGRAGLVLQDPQAQTILARCGDDVAFGCENLGLATEQIWRRVRQALAAVHLDVALSHPTDHLSGGQRQRLALAGVLAMAPGLLLLDEPTANLDPEGVREVPEAVGDLLEQTGTTVIVVEHRVDVWLDLVHRIVVLEPGGGVRADGPPSAVFAEHGRSLAEEGVWVPDRPPRLPSRTPDPRRGSIPLLRASNLAVARPGAAPAAADIDTQVSAGACLAVVGPNGAGKSTLGLTMAGLLAPAAGRVTAGRRLIAAGSPPRARGAGARGRSPAEPWSWRSADLVTRIGMVFQDPEHQFLTATVRSELLHGPRRAGVGTREATARAEELMARLRLSALAEANPFTLSGGEKRRLSVASALATRPPVLVLDEPTFGQDSRTWAEVVAIVADLLQDGVGALLVTHDDHVVAALADTVLTLPAKLPAGAPR